MATKFNKGDRVKDKDGRTGVIKDIFGRRPTPASEPDPNTKFTQAQVRWDDGTTSAVLLQLLSLAGSDEESQ